MTYLALLVFGFGIAAFTFYRPGWSVVALAAILGSLIILPKFFSHDPDANHIGIAQSVPAVATYTVIILGLAYAFALRVIYKPRGPAIPATAFVFLVFLAIGMTVIWSGTEEQLSGALQLILGYCAWFVGGQLGPLILSRARSVRWTAMIILALVAVEAVVTVAQRAGVRINPMGPHLASIMGDRTNGTTNHPDNLGKVILLLIILSLGLMGAADRRTRRILLFSIILGFVPLGLAEGRADILAALTTVVFWALLSGKERSLSIRIGIPLLIVLVALPFAGSIAKRVEEDPNGGHRAGLSESAYKQIDREPWGIGPNSYVTVVSPYSSVVAAGYPVHNTFLLTTAELGVLGAVLFWIPVAGLLVLAVLRRKGEGYRRSFSLAMLASAPGLYIVNATGWGLISFFPLPLWFLICGIAYSQLADGGLLTRLRTGDLAIRARLQHGQLRSRWAATPNA